MANEGGVGRAELPTAVISIPVHRLAEALEGMGYRVALDDQERSGQKRVCPTCREEVTELRAHPDCEQDVCTLCWAAADRIAARFQRDFERHRRDFRSQLPQMVVDVRSGADEPTFYRGLDG